MEIMGGQILELECVKRWNEGIEAGREEGRFQGILSTLNDLVKDGVLTVSEAARRASMTEENYVEQVKQLGL